MDFAGMVQTWIRVVSGPNEATFAQEQNSSNANLQTALIWVVLAAVVTSILGFIQSLLFASSAQGMLGMLGGMDLPPESQAMIDAMVQGGLFAGMSGAGALMGIIFTPILFLIAVGIVHLIATLFGGRGDFGRFAYLSAAISAPISIVNAVLAFIPVLGGCVALLISIYSIVLNYFAVKVAYSLSSGRAIAVILVPLIVVFALVFCVGFFFAAALAGLNS